jgi:AcrR family transcriptional regulator
VTEDLRTRQKLIQTAIELLREGGDPEHITVRQIAERAGVGIGLINYHFQTKDNLLNQAVNELIVQTADQAIDTSEDANIEPAARLRKLIKNTSNLEVKFASLSRLSLQYEILHGGLGAETTALPILREIFKGRKDELAVRIIAMTLIAPMQIAFINPDAFRSYSGIDVFDDKQRNGMIDWMIDMIISL